jgi:hypothetical protein
MHKIVGEYCTRVAGEIQQRIHAGANEGRTRIKMTPCQYIMNDDSFFLDQIVIFSYIRQGANKINIKNI